MNCNIDLTERLIGGILKEMEMPDSVGRLHSVVNKAATVSRKGGFTFYSFLSCR